MAGRSGLSQSILRSINSLIHQFFDLKTLPRTWTNFTKWVFHKVSRHGCWGPFNNTLTHQTSRPCTIYLVHMTLQTRSHKHIHIEPGPWLVVLSSKAVLNFFNSHMAQQGQAVGVRQNSFALKYTIGYSPSSPSCVRNAIITYALASICTLNSS